MRATATRTAINADLEVRATQLALAGVIFLGWQVILWQRQRNRVVVQKGNGRDVPFTIGENIRVLPGRVLSDSLALPPPTAPSETAVARRASSTATAIPTS